MTTETFRVKQETALEAARGRERRSGQRDLIGRVDGYCENADCAVREVKVHLKEYDGPIGLPLKCPSCGKVLNCHAVRTLAEQDR